jgi:hypothetical protein
MIRSFWLPRSDGRVTDFVNAESRERRLGI